MPRSALKARWASGGLHAPRMTYGLKSASSLAFIVGFHVDFGQNTEALLFQRCSRAVNGLVVRQVYDCAEPVCTDGCLTGEAHALPFNSWLGHSRCPAWRSSATGRCRTAVGDRARQQRHLARRLATACGATHVLGGWRADQVLICNLTFGADIFEQGHLVTPARQRIAPRHPPTARAARW